MPTDPTLSLPFLSASIAPTGGRLRSENDDFRVDEIPAYAPAGEGEHLFVRFEKIGLTTPEATRRIAEACEVDSRDIGYAGLKDKHARTTQWISVPGVTPAQMEALDLEGLKVLECAPHTAKLRTGHLRGNRFSLRVRGVAPDGVARAREALAVIEREGLPNYFGAQRFGRFFDNAERGLAWVKGERRAPRKRFERKMLASALQSQLFNEVVAARLRGAEPGAGLREIRLGDVAKKHDTGGLFTVQDEATRADAQERADAFALSPTGPLFGKKMRRAEGDAGDAEDALLSRFGLTWNDLARWGKNGLGSRRAVRVPLTDTSLEAAEDGYVVAFTLPKGSYATVVMRELMKPSGNESSGATDTTDSTDSPKHDTTGA